MSLVDTCASLVGATEVLAPWLLASLTIYLIAASDL